VKRYLVFGIVLIVQLGIIYAVYSWYVGGNVQNSAIPEPIVSEKKISNETLDALSKLNSNSLPSKLEYSKKEPKIEEVQKSVDEPVIFDYKNTVWGNKLKIDGEKDATTGILVDLNTNEVIWAKKCRVAVPIASMSKMMTIYLLMQYLNANPSITLNTEIQVTNEAAKIGGSQVWLDPKEKFTIRELLKTIVIKSANDSSYLIAQYIGNGNAQNFVDMMNKEAKTIGLTKAHFSNPDGLPEKDPDEDNVATAEDMAILAKKLLKYPIVVEDATTRLAYFREGVEKPTMLTNTNGLVKSNFSGVNGMKTGYTARAGFCITATCERDGVQLAAVVTGFKTSKERDKFVANLLNWGFSHLKESNTN